MTIILSETKTYLRVDYNDDDNLIQNLIDSAIDICADVSRHTVEEYINHGLLICSPRRIEKTRRYLSGREIWCDE